jgi:hypothetical protein
MHENISYKTCANDFINYTVNKNNINLQGLSMFEINKLYEPNNLYDYFISDVLDLILEDITSKLSNSIDINANILKIKKQILTIPVFESSNTKYICICNFNRFLSKTLKLVNPRIDDQIPIFHLLCLTPGMSDFTSISKVNGFAFNLMKSFWHRIEKNTQLLLREYTIDKLKIVFGSFVYAMQNKFPDFYVIFSSSKAPFDTRSSKFLTNFKAGIKKSKLAKKLNKLNNANNGLVRHLLKNTDVNMVKLNIDLDKLSLDSKQKKKITKKCITTDYNTMETSDDSKSEKQQEQIHTMCKYITGSKHCYYSGYKDMLQDFDKFCLEHNKSNKSQTSTFKPIDTNKDLNNENYFSMNM